MKQMNKIFKKSWKLNLERKFNGTDKSREYFTFMCHDKDGKPTTYEMTDKQMEIFEKSQLKKNIRQTFHRMSPYMSCPI